jgi:hypothetical protein
MKDMHLSIAIRSSIISSMLWAVFAILFIANLIGMYFLYFAGHEYLYGFVPRFNFDMENSIPTIFSSFILLLSSSLLWVVAMFKKKNNDLYFVHWLVLSIIFFWFFVDESASIHELLINPLRNVFNLSGIFYFSWVIPGLIFVFIFAILYCRFISNLPSRTRRQFIISAVIYICGAIGMELIGGRHSDIYGENNYTYGVITTFEESFEMIGILIFINALLKYIREYISNVKLSFE